MLNTIVLQNQRAIATTSVNQLWTVSSHSLRIQDFPVPGQLAGVTMRAIQLRFFCESVRSARRPSAKHHA